MSIRPAQRERVMTVALVTFGKSGERKDFTLEKKTTVIGRKPDADLRVPLSDVSRAHCEVTLNGKAATIRDLGSSNGTFINGERVDDDVKLAAGDRIRIGSITFVVQIDGEPAKIGIDAVRPPAVQTKPQAATGKKAMSDAATEVGASPADADLDDLDDLDLDDLDMDDLSDVDLSDEGSGALDELEELGEDDLIVDDDEDDK